MKRIFFLILLSFPLYIYSQTVAELDSIINTAATLSITYPDSALNIFNTIESGVIESNDYELKATFYRRKGNCYYFMSDYISASDNYLTALDIRESGKISKVDSTNIAEIGNLYYNLSIVNQYMGNYPIAIDFSKKLEDVYKSIQDYHYLAFRCYNYTSKLYYYIGDYENAMAYSFKEVDIAKQINDTILLSNAYDFQAVIKQGLNSDDEALDLQLESLKLRKSIKDSMLIAYSFNNIGSTYLRLEEYDKALEYFDSSLEIKKRNNFGGIEATYNNIGLALQNLGDYEESEKYYLKSYNYSKDVDNKYGVATAAINLGVIYHLMAKPNKADSYFTEAYDIAYSSGYKSMIVEVTEFAHSFYYDQNLCKKAYEMLLQNTIYKDSLTNEDIIKKIARIEAEHDFRQKQIADSVTYNQQQLRNEVIHNEELKRKEQLIWILIITFIFIIFIVFALFKAYQLRRKNQENLLKQQTLEIEKNLLRSQMNPHFIFNAMNSIQSFIAENDSYSALRYLSKFAKLIRLILENSMHQTIQLQDEIQSLQLYLELERVRFNNKFEFQFNVDSKIEADLIKVPPMLIQPFVENAIIHGIMPLKGNGLIKINLKESEEEGALLCEVIDNGIGRQASFELKKDQGKKHKSVGMQVSRQRLESLNKQTQKTMSCEVTDVIVDNKVCGTKVRILLPYESEF